MFELEIFDANEEIALFTTHNIFAIVNKAISDNESYPFYEFQIAQVRKSLLERYENKPGPSTFESKLAAISEKAFENFNNEPLGSTLKRHYSKLELDSKNAKENATLKIQKRVKEDQSQISLAELMAESKKSYFGIEREKQSLAVKKDPNLNDFLKNSNSTENTEKINTLENKPKISKRKFCDLPQNPQQNSDEKPGNKRIKNEDENKNSLVKITENSSLTDNVIIKKPRIQKEKEIMELVKKNNESGVLKEKSKENTNQNTENLNKNIINKVSKQKMPITQGKNKIDYSKVRSKIDTGLKDKSKK